MDSATLRGKKMGLEIEIKLNYENIKTLFPPRLDLQTETHTCCTCFLHDSDIGKTKSVLAWKILLTTGNV